MTISSKIGLKIMKNGTRFKIGIHQELKWYFYSKLGLSQT